MISRKEYKVLDRTIMLNYKPLAEENICQDLKENSIIRKLP